MNRILLALLAILIAIFIIGVNLPAEHRQEVAILEPEIKAEPIAVPPIKIISEAEKPSLPASLPLPTETLAELPEPQIIEQTETLPPETSAKDGFAYSAVRAEYVAEAPINIESIVLVRCLFRTQYYTSSSQPWGEENYNVGSGIIVSPSGNILTVKHILDVPEEALNDPAGRIWTRQKCDAALTDKNQSAISSIGFWGQQDDPRFIKAEIVFEPVGKDFQESFGLDFAILKIDPPAGGEDLSYTPLVPELLKFNSRDPLLAIGYPGRESVSPQKLERFDGEFLNLRYYSESPCGELDPCGLRYAFRRYPLDYKKDFWKPTEYGIITPYFRGGFSGAPVFFKGNLIGIVTHGVSGDKTKSGWDEVIALSSHDIALKLKEEGLAD